MVAGATTINEVSTGWSLEDHPNFKCLFSHIPRRQHGDIARLFYDGTWINHIVVRTSYD